MTNVNAENYSNEFSISLSYDKQPTYSVKIPKTIDVSNNATYFNYYVSGDIYADQILQVLFDSTTTIYSLDDTCNVQVSQNKTSYSQSELTSTYSQCEALITHQKLSAGNWIGELNVVISLVGAAQ